MAENLYKDLQTALQTLEDFLKTNTATIKTAVVALEALVPQLKTLIEELVTLLGQVKTEITNLNVAGIPGLAQVSQFTTAVSAMLNTVKALLPNEAAKIDEVLGAASVVTSLPSLDQVKAEIIKLIDSIIADLNNLKA